MPLADPFHHRYTKPELLGRGGFGEVYSAWDSEMDRRVALKILYPELARDPDWRKRFRQEATAASKLNHPNITIVFDRNEFQGQLYIVMEFVEGETLAQLIERQASLPEAQQLSLIERLSLVEQLCDGLHFAHQRHIVHRDIKPVNLVVHEERDGTQLARTLKILDFGIAKVLDTGQTSISGHLMFTPNYAAPEQVLGKQVDRRCDVFAVGAVAYELLSGKKAFVFTPSNHPMRLLDEVRRKIVEQPHTSMREIRPDLDSRLAAIVDRALAKNPADRYQDLAEMRRDVQKVRKRLEVHLEEDDTVEPTIVLDPQLQAAVRSARDALERGDPDDAVRQLEETLATTPNIRVRRLLERTLEEARAQQAAMRQQRLEEARQAIAAARAQFRAGQHHDAIDALGRFEPPALVASALDELRRALDLIERVTEVIQHGSPGMRHAGLAELAGFKPADLVAAAMRQLSAEAGMRDADERRKMDEAAAAHAQRARTLARESFQRGNRADAIATLERFDDPARVADLLDLLRDAARAIEVAASTVHSGKPRARTKALERLAAFRDRELVRHALDDLAARDQQRTDEEHDRDRRIAEAKARASATAKARWRLAIGRVRNLTGRPRTYAFAAAAAILSLSLPLTWLLLTPERRAQAAPPEAAPPLPDAPRAFTIERAVSPFWPPDELQDGRVPVGPDTPTVQPVASSTLIVDAAPWARILRIVDADGNELDRGGGYTPLSIAVPPGTYRVTLERDGQRRTEQVTLREREQQTARVQFERMDADEFLRPPP